MTHEHEHIRSKQAANFAAGSITKVFSLDGQFNDNSYLFGSIVRFRVGRGRVVGNSNKLVTMRRPATLALLALLPWRSLSAVPTRFMHEARDALIDAGNDGAITLENTPALLNLASDIVKSWMPPAVRTSHFLEMFGGRGGMTAKLKGMGYKGNNFDIKQDPSEDIRLFSAVLFLGYCVINIVPGGVVVCQPECATWLNMCRHHSARSSSDTVGNVEREDVQTANWTAAVMAWLLALCSSLRIRIFIEQTANSLLYVHMKSTLQIIGASRYISYGAAFGWKSMKCFEFWTTIPEAILQATVVRSHQEAKARLQCLIDLGKLGRPVQLAKLTIKRCNSKGWNQKGWVTGNRQAQSESQVYTDEFCAALADMVVACIDN